jgi:hypothetical protein
LSKVAEISVAGATIEMAEVVDRPDAPIAISESFDMNRGSVLQRLTEQQALTSLEIFINLQPTAEVPEVLTERHAAETVALGRTDTSVLKVAFDPNAAIEKWTSAGCDSVIFGNEGTAPGMIKYSRKSRFVGPPGGSFALGGPGRFDFVATSSDVNLGVCNNASTTMTWDVYTWEYDDTPTHTVNPGYASWYYRLYMGAMVPGNCGPGLICPPVRTKVTYGVNVWTGTDFLVRTAEARVVPQQVH